MRARSMGASRAAFEVATTAPVTSMARVTASRIILEFGLGMPTPRDQIDDAEPVDFTWSMGEDVIDAEIEPVEEL